MRVQRGPVVPLAPLPLGWAFVASFFPAGAKAIFFCPLSGSGAVAQSSPICTNRLFETGQVRRERSGNVHRLAQLDETKPVSTGRTKRPMKRRFSFVPGAARFLLPRQKKMWGSFLAPNRCLSHAGNGADAFQKGTHSPRRKRRDPRAPARSAGDGGQRRSTRYSRRSPAPQLSSPLWASRRRSPE